MNPNTIPDPGSLEPVFITPYSVTTTPQTIDPYAVDVAVIIPPGTTASIQTDADGPVSFDRTESLSLNCNNRALANTFVISRASGSGTILVLVSRVLGRRATNA